MSDLHGLQAYHIAVSVTTPPTLAQLWARIVLLEQRSTALEAELAALRARLDASDGDGR